MIRQQHNQVLLQALFLVCREPPSHYVLVIGEGGREKMKR